MTATATLTRPSRRTIPHRKQVMETMTPRRVDLPGSEDGLDLSTLGGRLAMARMRAKITQEELARQIDKSRPTVLQYEHNKISPPVHVVTQMASILKVSPSYIAYGEHGIATKKNELGEIISIEEVAKGRNGRFVKGTIALSRALAESYAPDTSKLRAYVLDHNAPVFDLRDGDRVIVDASVSELVGRYDMYLISSPTGGFEIVRYEHTFANTKAVSFMGPNGKKLSVVKGDLTILGAVVSTLRKH